jgi:hypothetical protein
MPNMIKVKRSAVAGKVPAVGDLQLGELAINTYDGKLFLKKSVGGNETIVDVTSSTHTHGISDVTGLQSALDSKADASVIGDISAALAAINGA